MPAFPNFVRPILNRGGSQAYVSSGWGADRSYRSGTHNGLDFPAADGTPVRAVASGKVITVADWGSNGGKAIVIEHAPGLKTRYLHLSKFNVEVGDNVTTNQIIGHSGHTGIAASAAHLHFDIRGTDPWINEYIRRFGTPTPWPGEKTSGGYGIPAEPLVPVDVYAGNVAEGAAARRVPLRGATGIGLLGIALLIGGGLLIWKAARAR